jgi:UDP-N-acetyl-D-mannosaminuronic acid dehydrogenase
MTKRVVVLGGCGHVGLPISLVLADAGFAVDAVDRSSEAVAQVNRGSMPFLEDGAEELLQRVLGRTLTVTADVAVVAKADAVICVIGTPIDEHLNPRHEVLLDAVAELVPHLHKGQLLVLRSTVAPGTTEVVARYLALHAPGVLLAVCPERVAQGKAIVEIRALPQIIAGTTPEAVTIARELFEKVCHSVIELSTAEAELAKLFCNSWRYISFAVANQMYSICADAGVDYYIVRDAMMNHYPRMASLPGAGLAAGPCLFKDTMQLACSSSDSFTLGRAAVEVNEGFPRRLLEQLRPMGLVGRTVGLLGMTFKANSDDARDSLAFRLRKLLHLEGAETLCTDVHVKRPWLLPVADVLDRAEVIIISSPHDEYRHIRPRQPVLDPWNLLGRGGLLI